MSMLPHLKVTYELAENHHAQITFEEWRQRRSLGVLHGWKILLSGYYLSAGWLGMPLSSRAAWQC